jgi:hypothetical protein
VAASDPKASASPDSGPRREAELSAWDSKTPDASFCT